MGKVASSQKVKDEREDMNDSIATGLKPLKAISVKGDSWNASSKEDRGEGSLNSRVRVTFCPFLETDDAVFERTLLTPHLVAGPKVAVATTAPRGTNLINGLSFLNI